MEKICMIMDMEGYFLPRFYCRELGVLGMDWLTTKRYFYHMPINYLELTPSQATTVMFVKRRIHGLPFVPSYMERARPAKQLYEDIKEFYDAAKTPDKFVVAYKGGTCEKDVLQELGIPFQNLEDFDCPKIETLIHQGYGKDVSDCGFHHIYEQQHLSKACIHCASMECSILKEWVDHQTKLPKETLV